MRKYYLNIVIVSVFIIATAIILSSCTTTPKQVQINKEPYTPGAVRSTTPDTTIDRVHTVPPGTVITINGKRPLLLTFWTAGDVDVNITVQVTSVPPDPPNSSGPMPKLIKAKDASGNKYYYPMLIDYIWGSTYNVTITNPPGSPDIVFVSQRLDMDIIR